MAEEIINSHFRSEVLSGQLIGIPKEYQNVAGWTLRNPDSGYDFNRASDLWDVLEDENDPIDALIEWEAQRHQQPIEKVALVGYKQETANASAGVDAFRWGLARENMFGTCEQIESAKMGGVADDFNTALDMAVGWMEANPPEKAPSKVVREDTAVTDPKKRFEFFTEDVHTEKYGDALVWSSGAVGYIPSVEGGTLIVDGSPLDNTFTDPDSARISEDGHRVIASVAGDEVTFPMNSLRLYSLVGRRYGNWENEVVGRLKISPQTHRGVVSFPHEEGGLLFGQVGQSLLSSIGEK